MNELSTRRFLSLASDRDRLYGELIQAISARQLYWFRPLFLVEDTFSDSDFNHCNFIDLRQSSDLLLPQVLFEDCFDTEVISLLTELYNRNSLPNESMSRRYLYNFIRSIWQQDRQMFSSTF